MGQRRLFHVGTRSGHYSVQVPDSAQSRARRRTLRSGIRFRRPSLFLPSVCLSAAHPSPCNRRGNHARRTRGSGLAWGTAPATGHNGSVSPANPVVPQLLENLHIDPVNSGACHGDWIAEPAGAELISFSPATGEPLARVRMAAPPDYQAVMARASDTFLDWRMMPAPQRGDIVREIGNELRAHKQDLGALVSLEMGKILPEGLGEVQEMIDIADFAVGLSRQLYGLTMHSERPGHRMYEHWHPLGIGGVISAFNFPVAVWSWNALIAAVCGDCVLWRPSSDTPLTAIAVQKISNRVLDRHGLKGIFNLVIGRGDPVGEAMLRS